MSETEDSVHPNRRMHSPKCHCRKTLNVINIHDIFNKENQVPNSMHTIIPPFLKTVFDYDIMDDFYFLLFGFPQ